MTSHGTPKRLDESGCVGNPMVLSIVLISIEGII